MSLLSVPLADLHARQSLKWRTYPADVLPLWVAEMDVHLPPVVLAALTEALTAGDTGYPHGTGYAEAFTQMAQDRWSWPVEARQVRRAGDVMNSILAVLEAVTTPGDAVVITPPVYPPFRQVVSGYGRQVVEAPLGADGRLDLGSIEAAFTAAQRPAAFLLCSPHNPTGVVHTEAELAGLMALANTHGVQVIADEIHAPLVDADTSFVPVQTVAGGEQAITVTSAGKAWNLAGFKAGLIIAGAGVDRLFGKLPPFTLHSAGHLADLAHTAALRHAQSWVDELMVEIGANRKLLASELAAKLPQVHYRPQPGTYLAWVDCTELGFADPSQQFLDVGRVAFSPGANFGAAHAGWVRVNLACSPAVVTEAVDRMVAALA
ncbi:cystathionine beta-lyase [Propionicimonas paludicola]|uniref:cysteine-S-conjugate beta-lyase n=1 Tax=Propionicimonas paludicola TaxID=185243 RepID=A0A2A9CR92_9ACTN|nr:aminotransferase class I/II-fold pyridoxal phosphate-dependent enzyme [Propionicimonas paludicola]PFG16636.1 cystathionine beta-lyase [Propionicimonas paludicola]